MSLQPTTGAQPDIPKTCGDTRYPHKHPTLDICYTPAGYKKYLEQNTGAGSAGAGTAGGGKSIGACGTWCNIRDGAKQGTGCPSALTCADPPPPPPPQPWSPPPPLSPIWGPTSETGFGGGRLANASTRLVAVPAAPPPLPASPPPLAPERSVGMLYSRTEADCMVKACGLCTEGTYTCFACTSTAPELLLAATAPQIGGPPPRHYWCFSCGGSGTMCSQRRPP